MGQHSHAHEQTDFHAGAETKADRQPIERAMHDQADRAQKAQLRVADRGRVAVFVRIARLELRRHALVLVLPGTAVYEGVER